MQVMRRVKPLPILTKTEQEGIGAQQGTQAARTDLVDLRSPFFSLPAGRRLSAEV